MRRRDPEPNRDRIKFTIATILMRRGMPNVNAYETSLEIVDAIEQLGIVFDRYPK